MRFRTIAVATATVSALALSTAAEAHQQVDRRLLRMLRDVPASEIPDRPGRIRKGRDLFLNETFGGNGRTCGTCHMPTENFALNAADIARRPQSDPLFVAENVPALAGLENPQLMRQFGLILENLDGFGNPGVMRGVPHTLGLRRSIQPDIAGNFPLVNALGLSGDGSPNDGSLNNFALGAIVQHFPRSLSRQPGIDFRLPTRQELRAMADFQLSLGRQSDPRIDGTNGTPIVFADSQVESGKQLFITAPARNGMRSCNACHGNAGALDANGGNRQRDTGTAQALNAPVCRGNAPGDGGFGISPVREIPVESICSSPLTPGVMVVFRGNGTMNTPSLVEAADTEPFFHNNSAATLEDSIRHYTSAAFAQSPAGGNNPFVLDDTQVNEIGAFLRAVNAMENVRNGIAVDRRALSEPNRLAIPSVREALSETQDAIRVIQQAQLPIYQDTRIVPLLQEAAEAETAAISANPARRRSHLAVAISRKTAAQDLFTR